MPLRDDDDVRAFVPWPLVCLDSGYDWDAAEAWLGDAEGATRRGDQPLTRGQVLSFQAGFALWRGSPVTAARLIREAIPSLMRRDPLRRLPIAWLYLVMSTASPVPPVRRRPSTGPRSRKRRSPTRNHRKCALGPRWPWPRE
jgi:hypothetical protein